MVVGEASGESLDTDEINLAKSLRAELHVLMIRSRVSCLEVHPRLATMLVLARHGGFWCCGSKSDKNIEKI